MSTKRGSGRTLSKMGSTLITKDEWMDLFGKAEPYRTVRRQRREFIAQFEAIQL
jgi:hypothetical protein